MSDGGRVFTVRDANSVPREDTFNCVVVGASGYFASTHDFNVPNLHFSMIRLSNMWPNEDYPELVIHSEPVSTGPTHKSSCALCQDRVAGGISTMLGRVSFFV